MNNAIANKFFFSVSSPPTRESRHTERDKDGARMLDILLLFLAILAVSWWFLVATRHPKNFPPGPRWVRQRRRDRRHPWVALDTLFSRPFFFRFSLPVIGNSLAIGSDLGQGFEKLRKKYGDMVGLYLGPDRAVVVSDFDLIQELGNSLYFSDRKDLNSSADVIRAGLVKSGDAMTVGGIILSNGPTWIEQRRYALHVLRDLGFGKNSMEELIRDEVDQLCKHLEKKKSEAIDIKNHFNISVLNSLWAIATNEKLEYEDPKMKKIIYVLDKALQEFGSPINQIAISYKPLLFLIKNTNIFSTLAAVQGIKDILQDAISEHVDTYQEDSMRDFIDHFIREIKEKSTMSEESSFKGADGWSNLMSTMIDFFVAGSETTSTTLNWAMLCMIKFPDIQKKVQEELDKLTGRGRMATWADRPETPYTEAVIHEVQRYANILPLSVFHATSTDTHLGGYYIPKNTAVFPNIGHVMRDPKNFPDPEKFDPTRYLTLEGKFNPHPMVVPFGMGKRRCLGETLAKMSLYLFFTGILSYFNLKMESENDYISSKSSAGVVLSPLPYKLRFMPRE